MDVLDVNPRSASPLRPIRFFILVSLCFHFVVCTTTPATAENWNFVTFIAKRNWKIDVVKDNTAANTITVDSDDSVQTALAVDNGTLVVNPSPSYDGLAIGSVVFLANAEPVNVRVDAASAKQGRFTAALGDLGTSGSDDPADEFDATNEAQVLFTFPYDFEVGSGKVVAASVGLFSDGKSKEAGRYHFVLLSSNSFLLTLHNTAANSTTTWIATVPHTSTAPSFFQQWGMPILMVFVFTMMRAARK
eukprot:PhF_6_TR11246/c0_g1_i1/m.18137